MPVDEYEISAHTGQRFRSRGWNNGVGFRLCMQLLPGSVYETHCQNAGCQWGSGFVSSVASSLPGSNVLVIFRHGSVNGVVRRMTSTGRRCVRCSVTVSYQQSAGCPRLESSDVLCARSLRS